MPTPNYFYRNYAIGRTHTGMLAYLCDWYNNGNQQPLREVLVGLGFTALDKLPKLIDAKFEFKQADLGLFDGDHCFLLIEMKVDDREGMKKAGKNDVFDNTKGWYKGLQKIDVGKSYRQTDLYRNRAHQNNRWAMHAENLNKEPRKKYAGPLTPGYPPEMLFVTLGVGEYNLWGFADPAVVRHVGLDQWTSAFAKIQQLKDAVCDQYQKALEHEQTFRNLSASAEAWTSPVRSEELRWHIKHRSSIHPAMSRLAKLQSVLIVPPDNWPEGLVYNPVVTTAGPGVSILQFLYPHEGCAWRNTYPLYIELMGSGMLRFKLAAEILNDKPAKQDSYNEILEVMGLTDGKNGREGLQEPSKKSNPQTTKHLTLAELPVGLTNGVRFDEKVSNIEEVRQNVQKGLNLYAALMKDLVPNADFSSNQD